MKFQCDPPASPALLYTYIHNASPLPEQLHKIAPQSSSFPFLSCFFLLEFHQALLCHPCSHCQPGVVLRFLSSYTPALLSTPLRIRAPLRSQVISSLLLRRRNLPFQLRYIAVYPLYRRLECLCIYSRQSCCFFKTYVDSPRSAFPSSHRHSRPPPISSVFQELNEHSHKYPLSATHSTPYTPQGCNNKPTRQQACSRAGIRKACSRIKSASSSHRYARPLQAPPPDMHSISSRINSPPSKRAHRLLHRHHRLRDSILPEKP